MTSAPRYLGTIGTILVAAVISLLFVAAPVAAADTPESGSGTGVITGLEVVSQRTAGRNSIQERVLTVAVTGTLEGELVQHVRGVVHDGQFVTFQGTATFTGTMEGCGEGTLTLGLSGKGSAGPHPVTEATVQVIDQSSNTIGARGVGTVSQDGPLMTYEIQFTC